ncbi:MAG: hypothetical protein EON93_02985 [Burkholderiales bacterium]|nr:MAG: hypothetical protein EON93_02985 [Burkholderiales bacterium]
MSTGADLPQMTASLQRILESELARGNTIAEVSAWLPKCRLLVLLKKPFFTRYKTPGEIEYASIDDRHYWKSEYRFNGGEEVLACGFG